jgi:hypothetical protein
MALTTTILDSRVTNIVVKETVLTNTGGNDVFGNPTRLSSIELASGSGQNGYLFIYDNRSATIGQAPKLTFLILAGQTRTYYFPDGIDFTVGVCFRCVNSASQSGNTTPTGSAIVGRFVGTRI